MRTINDETRRGRDDDDEGVAFDNVKVERATPKALLCNLGERLVPNSCIHDDSEVYLDEDDQSVQGSPGKLVVKTWFARKEGLA